ncbi:MAG: ATP-binding protein [Thermodesulfobacteriota bacterium]|nr:ATP-binding protein [Thermodesulfobacteriota bacterium]
MPSRINPLRSIWFRLLLNFIAIIIITVGMFCLIAKFKPRETGGQEWEETLRFNGPYLSRLLFEGPSASWDPEKLSASLNEYGTLTGMHLMVVGPDGRIVAQSRQKANFGSLLEGVLNEKVLKEALAKGPVSGSQFLSDGHYTALVSYSFIPLYSRKTLKGLFVIVSPHGPPRPAMERLSLQLLQALVIVLLIASLAALLLSWNFIKPIKAMQQASRKMIEGDFSTRMSIERDDELGELARDFNFMALSLKKNIESRMRLMGDISHELNTPIAALRVNIEGILDGIVTGEREKRALLEGMLRQADRISILIDDILEISRFEAGAIKMVIEPFDPGEPARMVIESSAPLVRERCSTLSFRDESGGAYAMGDRNRILQVVQNLVDNALFHNPDGTSVVISVERRGESLVFSVEDDGVGIPPEDRESVFKRFYRGDPERARKSPGSGLGLAIAREIIEGHQSSLALEPKETGTRFVFRLPAAPHEAVAEQIPLP